MKTKSIAMIMAMVMMVVGLVSGTLAWLTDSTGEVKNTFTTSDIAISLDETDDLDLKMVPGFSITKDPVVTVSSGSEQCFVFVKIEKSSNYSKYLEDYTVAGGWTKLTEDADGNAITDDIYYAKVTSIPEGGWTQHVLDGDKVTVKGTVSKADMELIDGVLAEGQTSPTVQEELAARPTLTFTAYASQLYKDGSTEFTAAEAWANVPKA